MWKAYPLDNYHQTINIEMTTTYETWEQNEYDGETTRGGGADHMEIN
jgi:hypothetical protein